jgi:EmrB/QacA subfamily drug resistance transporter
VTIQAPSQPATAAAVGARRRRLLPHGHPGLVLTLILACQLMVVLDATIVNIALQDIKHALHFSPAGLSWVVNAYSLTFGGLLLLGARSGDLLGRRRTFIAGLTIFTLASLAGGFAQTSGQLLAARAVQGMGAALASPSALALLMVMFPQGRERTRAIGLYTAVSIGGSAVGLIAGGMLSEWAAWRWVLFVNVPIGAVAIALARLVLPETERRKGRFDLVGALTSTLGMAALVYGFVHAATDGWRDTGTIVSFIAGLVLIGLFIRTEMTAEAPITPLRLFANRNRSSAYVVRLLLVAGMMGMFFFLTQFLRGVLGYSDLKTGFAFVPLTVVIFGASQLSARHLIERFGQRPLMLVGISFSTLGMLWLTQLSEGSGYFSLLGPLVVFGLGNGLAFVPLTTMALDGVDPADAGAASGLVNVMQQVGGALGLAVLVTIFGTASQHAAEHPAAGQTPAQIATHAFVSGADAAFWMATGLIVAALGLITFAIRTRKDEPAAVPADVDPDDADEAADDPALGVQAHA